MEPAANLPRPVFGIVVLQEPPLLRWVLREEELGRWDEMGAEDALEELGVQILIEDVAVAESTRTEASPQMYLHRVRFLVDGIQRI